MRTNANSIAELTTPRTLKWLFDSRFVKAMTAMEDWIHLEILAEEPTKNRDHSWLRTAIDNVGRAMLEGEMTLLQKAVAARFGGHENLRPSPAEDALLKRTYENPKWYMQLRADYPLVLRAIECLDSGKLDESYNKASWNYSTGQGISTRWNCPVWVAAKTIYTAVERSVEANVDGDEYVSDFFDILCSVVERSKYSKADWESERCNREFPTAYAYLIYGICHDLEDLWVKTARQGLFRSAPMVAQETPRCKTIANIWGLSLWNLASNKVAASERFRVALLHSFLRAVLTVRFVPYDLFGDDPDASQVVLDSYRDVLLDGLVVRVHRDEEAIRILCSAAESLDRGKEWVQRGGQWLERTLSRVVGWQRGIGGGPPGGWP
jgi:hypothetical protein